MAPFAVLHIPHSSRVIPADVRRAVLLGDDDLASELLRMTDAYTDELFRIDPHVARVVIFPVSRLVVDPERFSDDAAEPMASRGMGMIYTHTSDGEPLRLPPSAAERERLAGLYYRPHHHALAAALSEALERFGATMMVDCHSFPSVPLPYELDQRLERPQICIGTDAFHSPAALVAGATHAFGSIGFTVAIDRPFSGALVPDPFYGRDHRVQAIMVEVNRALYMDERIGERGPSFDETAAKVRECTARIIEAARDLAIAG